MNIPIQRIIDKLDSFLDRNDTASAERLLRDWISEADSVSDLQGKMSLINEQIGLYRKLSRENECISAINCVLDLTERLQLGDTVSGATAFINAATGYKSFGYAEKALPLYERAREIYEASLASDDERLAGLYNNMALTLSSLGRFREAENLFGKALEILKSKESGEAEMAITYLNLADLTADEEGTEAGFEKIDAYVSKAEELLDSNNIPRNGYYAFVCEKCAPVFGFYGYFLAEKKFSRRAKEIYERA